MYTKITGAEVEDGGIRVHAVTGSGAMNLMLSAADITKARAELRNQRFKTNAHKRKFCKLLARRGDVDIAALGGGDAPRTVALKEARRRNTMAKKSKKIEFKIDAGDLEEAKISIQAIRGGLKAVRDEVCKKYGRGGLKGFPTVKTTKDEPTEITIVASIAEHLASNDEKLDGIIMDLTERLGAFGRVYDTEFKE